VFQSVSFCDDIGHSISYLPLGQELRIRIGIQTHAPIDSPTIGIGFDDVLGQRVLTLHTPKTTHPIPRLLGTSDVECVVPVFPLAPGDYWLKLAIAAHGEEIDVVDRAACLRVADGDAFSDGRGFTRGTCIADSRWALNTPVIDSRLTPLWWHTMLKSTFSRIRNRFLAPSPQDMGPDLEHGPEYYDDAYRSINAYHVPYWHSPYYFLWSVIADRIRREGASSVLEVGCGPGQLAELLLEQGVSNYTGVDFSPAAIEIARRRLPSVEFIVDDARSSSIYEKIEYDAIVCTEVLEHIEDDLRVIGTFPSGKICVCSVPSFPYKSHVRFFGDACEVKNRYGRFFDKFDVMTLRVSHSGSDRIYLMQGVRSKCNW
jgi:hypothetical protein